MACAGRQRQEPTLIAMAGYSTTPLPGKLGIKAGFRIGLIDAPANYHAMLGPLPPGVRFYQRLVAPLDLIHLFAASLADLNRSLPRAKKALGKDGMLWLSWPKKSSGVNTDLDGNVVRKTGLATGLVDIKVCAVSDTWSGLKFVYRKKDR